MAVLASIIFSEPASIAELALAPNEGVKSTLYSVAGALEFVGYDHPTDVIAPQAAEEVIDKLLAIVVGLSSHCGQEGDHALIDGIEGWLAARGRF